MSILIKGMTAEQLEDVFSWARIGANNCMIGYGVTAIELPDHGDLIDRDVMKHGFCVECTLYPDRCLKDDCDWGSIYHLEHTPVVIPAERSEE